MCLWHIHAKSQGGGAKITPNAAGPQLTTFLALPCFVCGSAPMPIVVWLPSVAPETHGISGFDDRCVYPCALCSWHAGRVRHKPVPRGCQSHRRARYPSGVEVSPVLGEAQCIAGIASSVCGLREILGVEWSELSDVLMYRCESKRTRPRG